MRGWYNQSYRHSLAAKGIRTNFQVKRRYDYAMLDVSGKDELESDYRKEIYVGTPEEIRLFLEKRNFEVKSDPALVNDTIAKLELNEDVMSPYIVVEGGEIVDYGNMYVLEAADLAGIEKVDFLIYTPPGEMIEVV